MALTAAEQYLIELINRARLDPGAEAQRYGVSLNAGISQGGITTAAKQVLAPDTNLEKAAVAHSDWMLQQDTFSHTGVQDSNPGGRMEAAGYDFTGSYVWRENLAWSGTTGNLDLQAAILDHHEGLYRSATHRVNTFADDIREVGIGQVAGTFTHNGKTYNTSMLTQNFASSGSDVFITGVTYADRNGNDFYDIGEGRSGYSIKVGSSQETTESAGGYGLALDQGGPVDVTVLKSGKVVAQLAVDLSQGNVKLDVVEGSGGSVLMLSGSAELKNGIGDAKLLGVANLDLTAGSGRNKLEGNSGSNTLDGGKGRDLLEGGKGSDVLIGGGGKDRLEGDGGRDQLDGGGGRDKLIGGSSDDQLFGGGGKDKLKGNGGRDQLDGGGGNDKLAGGGGKDTFIFNAGRDKILDFKNNKDTIAIDADLLDAGEHNAVDVMDHAKIVKGDAVFTFDGGHTLIVEDVGNLNILVNDLAVV